MPNKNWYPPYRYFKCECDTEKELSFEELVAHAKKEHKIDIRGVVMQRYLMMHVHVNKQPRHSCTFKWEAPNITFYEYVG